MLTKTRSRNFKVEDLGDVSVVTFIDKKLLDPKEIQIMGEELSRLVDEQGRQHLILDFQHVEYLSSTALGKFINLYKKLKTTGGKLVIRNINTQIQELFDLCCLPWETIIEGAQPA